MIRPNELPSITVEGECGCGKIFLIAGFMDGILRETFIKVDHQEQCGRAGLSALARMTSLALWSGVTPDQIVKSLKGTRCDKPLLTKQGNQLSCFDVVAGLIELADLEYKEPDCRPTLLFW